MIAATLLGGIALGATGHHLKFVLIRLHVKGEPISVELN
jgi:hypothetical protein